MADMFHKHNYMGWLRHSFLIIFIPTCDGFLFHIGLPLDIDAECDFASSLHILRNQLSNVWAMV
jgi:hypothetical protein